MSCCCTCPAIGTTLQEIRMPKKFLVLTYRLVWNQTPNIILAIELIRVEKKRKFSEQGWMVKGLGEEFG